MTSHADVKRIQDPARREHFVYWAYDANGVLLYIGCTMQPKKRWAEHCGKPAAAWTRHVARFRAQGPYNYETARRMERQAIDEHQPPFNNDHAKAMAARAKRSRLFEDLMSRYMTAGLSFEEAGRRVIAEVDAASPHHREYRPLVSA